MTTTRREIDGMEKTVDFYDSEGRLVLSATLGIRISEDFPGGQLDSVNRLLWDFPNLVKDRILSDDE